MPQTPIDRSFNRDDAQKAGRPPRPATEPHGAEGSSRTPKTRTDPATGAPMRDAPAPNQSKSDDVA
jgi:hypothetical protein